MLIFRPGELTTQTPVVQDGQLLPVTFVVVKQGSSCFINDGKRQWPATLAEYLARLRYLSEHGGHLSYSVVGGLTPEDRAAYKAELEKPGRPPVTHHREWATRFLELRAEEDSCESPVEGGERPLSDYELRLLVAYEDYEKHQENWPNYNPADNRRGAADRVHKAIKPLI